MIKNLYIGYYRVSREEQGKSGLGLQAQKRAVTDYVNGNGILIGEFQDVESGASEERQGMIEAIKACKLQGATLVVKEMSRISRGGYKFRQQLEEASINFLECSSPHDPEVVKDIKFALAKEERSKVRQRTKDALAEIKHKLARGEEHISKSGNVITTLGNPDNLTDKAREKSIIVRKKKAINNPLNRMAGSFIVELKNQDGNISYHSIARKLNNAGFKTSRGNEFTQVQVSRLYRCYNGKV
jgi:DNA invertase Pin-like site-specific DNA recombinase